MPGNRSLNYVVHGWSLNLVGDKWSLVVATCDVGCCRSAAGQTWRVRKPLQRLTLLIYHWISWGDNPKPGSLKLRAFTSGQSWFVRPCVRT